MKNYLFNAIAILSIALFVSCAAQNSDQENTDTISNPTYGTWQDQSESPLKFELEQVFGDNEEILLPQSYQLVGPAIDSTGNLYVIDGQNGTMYSFDPEGNLRWETGEEGTGPGDFERPQGLVTDGKYLYTGNVSGSRIDQFDLEGNLVNSTSLESLDLSFTTVEGFLSDSLLVTSSTIWQTVGREIIVLNKADNLEIVTQFKTFSIPEIELGEGLGFSTDINLVDSLIAVGNVQDYALQFYNIQGEKVKTVTRDFSKLVRPGFIRSESVGGFGSLKAPLYLPEGYYMTTLLWPTNIDDPDQFLEKILNNDAPEINYENSMDLYDTDGTLLYALEQEGRNPEVGSISHVDENGNIYTKSDDPFPQIRRYSLTINAPDE